MGAFEARHVGPTADEQSAMLNLLGYATLDDLTDAAIPSGIRMQHPLDLPAAATEAGAQQTLHAFAAANNPGRAMIGMGYHGTITPAVIRRNVLENPAWYTAYTPYQPEISQGRLEVLEVFQTMVAELTGLPIAGASLLDEATAVAEAMALARRQNRKGRVCVFDSQILPQSLAVVQTRALGLEIELVAAQGNLLDALVEADAFAVVVQVPGVDGAMPTSTELRALAEAAHAKGALVIAACDLLSLTVTVPPGDWGADIAVGTTQRFGVPLFYGGPHAGYIAVREGLERQIPGRIVGLSRDADGTPAFRLALQTREQHIRREKATSNICTAQVLLAVASALYAVYHGPSGLVGIAESVMHSARRLAHALTQAGWTLAYEQFFDTLLVNTPGSAEEIVQKARQLGVHVRKADADHVGISVGEDATTAELAAVCEAFGAAAPSDEVWGGLVDQERASNFLTHPVFNAYHSETAMLRYLRTLADRDFALDRGMIPLGSCTMKLNPAAAMEPISYPGFANLHPFVPIEDAQGYVAMIDDLQQRLAVVTGYDSVSIQPNAGSQGEFAGLMAIRCWHLANGDDHRTVCLIPASAHGTNAASAAMAGMTVVVVGTDEDGSVDLRDLAEKVDKYRDNLAAIMVTYPSTHGVFEDTISEVCRLVHEAGGQVYVDGANMNAMLGLTQPGVFGADVSHLNLHKTFAIPHGGGGPGVGPVAVRRHLAPYLPSHPLLAEAGPDTSYGPVSAAPFGSAGVLPITYAFMDMMGPDGLRHASQTAILNANYIATRLGDAYPILYTGDNGLVAHECILDLRLITRQTGVTVEDVAKRLIDYGFHAPTMSFPVAGTLMVEPTESENLGEIDRFCDAMIAIRAEIDSLSKGVWPADDNPLVNAPHPASRVTSDEWSHPYSRTVAAYPDGRRSGATYEVGRDKYWPPVARIDNAFGDRNLVCSCPPLSEYSE